MLQTLKNKIIESDNPVGCKKTSNWILPEKEFAYGKKDIPDPEGVEKSKIIFLKKVTRSWQVHKQTNPKTPQQDFVIINKIAIKNDNKGKVIIFTKLL